MNPETVNAIKDALTPIAAKIGQGAQYGWNIVLRQQYIEGITNMVFVVFWGILITVGVKLWKTGRDRDEDGTAVFGAIISIIGIIFAGLCLWDGVTHLLNPDYYALDFFIHLGTPTQ